MIQINAQAGSTVQVTEGPIYNNYVMGDMVQQKAVHLEGERKVQATAGPERCAAVRVPPQELCLFIHPAVVDEEEQQQIHMEIVNLARRCSIPNICLHLASMAKERRILLPIEGKTAYAELQRLGMPGADCVGYGMSNFKKYYRK